MAKITIDIPDEFSGIVKKKNIFIMSIILATLIDRLLESKIGLEELSEEDLETIMQIDDAVKKGLLKHYSEEKT